MAEGEKPRDGRDWEDRTEQRPVPSDELLDAMKHPDVPEVVLEAIARRSSSPPAPLAEEPDREPGEDTARYLLGRGAPLAARLAEAESNVRAETQRFRLGRSRSDEEQTLAMPVFMGFVFFAAVAAWWSFELWPR